MLSSFMACPLIHLGRRPEGSLRMKVKGGLFMSALKDLDQYGTSASSMSAGVWSVILDGWA